MKRLFVLCLVFFMFGSFVLAASETSTNFIIKGNFVEEDYSLERVGFGFWDIFAFVVAFVVVVFFVRYFIERVKRPKRKVKKVKKIIKREKISRRKR